MIKRLIDEKLKTLLKESPVVTLLGPRQAGKSTIARELASRQAAQFFDLENPADKAALENSLLILRHYQDKLIVLDEVQRMPDLFPILRVLVDENRRPGRFLLLGSATPNLRRQSSESLTGRSLTLELTPFLVSEAVPAHATVQQLWTRGGFPPSLMAVNPDASLRWREQYLRDLVERDLHLLGFQLPSETMWRFVQMLAHNHGQLWNTSQLARSLDIGTTTGGRYLDAIMQTFLVRRLLPFHRNLGKRLSKSPKVYFRDSGLLHSLLGIRSIEQLLGHPVSGFSWEGFVIEQAAAHLPDGWTQAFWRTATGAEIDLLLLYAGEPCIGIEIKSGLVPKPSRGFYAGCEDLKLTERWVVYAGDRVLNLAQNTLALPLKEMIARLRGK
jgi:hypothetical protein